MYLLLALSIVAAAFNSVVLHRARLDGCGAVFRYNGISAAVWCVLLFVSNGFTLRVDGGVLLWGAVYGVTQTLFILSKTLAMNSGPVSVTTLIGNCSMVISVIACFIIWGEPATGPDVLGLAVLLAGILLTTYKKSGGEFRRGWKYFCALFFVCAAGVGLIFKGFSKSGGERAGDMMLVSAIVMLLCYSAICLVLRARTKKEKDETVKGGSLRVFFLLAVLSGLLSCVYNRLNVYLSGALDGVIFFPSFNGGVVILSTLLGVLLLGERPKKRQLLGIFLGVVGICIIGIF